VFGSVLLFSSFRGGMCLVWYDVGLWGGGLVLCVVDVGSEIL
jgi:hypothetical protein